MRKWSLHHGDCYPWLRALPSGCADLLLCDPPFSSGGFTRGDRTSSTKNKYLRTDYANGASRFPDFTGDNRDQRGQLAWMMLWLGECRRCLKTGSHALIHTDWRQLPLTTDAVQAAGFVWRGIVAWHKPAHRPNLGGVSAACEFIVHATNGLTDTSRPQIRGFFSKSAPSTKKRRHQTEKPGTLVDHLLGLAIPGETILDPFAGSGVVGERALARGLRYMGCEIDAFYYGNAREALDRAEG